MRRHLPSQRAQKRSRKRMPPVGSEMITSWKDPEIIRRRGPLRVFRLRRLRHAARLRPLVLRLRPRPRLERRAAVAAIAAAVRSLPAAEGAPRTVPPRPPHLRRTSRLLLPAVGAGARTKLLVSRREKKNGSEARSRFSFA